MDLANTLIACMKSNDSIIYIGFNLQVKRAYYGMVHERPPHKRWQEHWRAVLQHVAGIASETERKYEYMARHGGAASWPFLPYIIIIVWASDSSAQAAKPGAENHRPLP